MPGETWSKAQLFGPQDRRVTALAPDARWSEDVRAANAAVLESIDRAVAKSRAPSEPGGVLGPVEPWWETSEPRRGGSDRG